MSNIFIYTMLWIVYALASALALPGTSEEEMIKGAKDLDQRFITAYQNSDVEGVMACYWNSPELINFPPGALQERGYQEVREGLSAFFSATPEFDLKLLETNYKVMGDVVLGWGTWYMKIPTPDGQTVEMTGRYSDVKAKRGGKWVYIFDHASVPLPPPPDAKEE